MKLNVSGAIREPGLTIPFQALQPVAEMELRGDRVAFDDALMTGTMIAGADGAVILTGELKTVAHTRCARCLKPADVAVQAQFREVFYRGENPDDPDAFSYQSQEIDLELLASTTVLLELPIKILCSPDCSGIAEFTIGTDQEWTESDASQRHPFAALQQLLTKDEEV